MLTNLCTLPVPDAWFDELSTRLPLVDIHRLAPAKEPIPTCSTESICSIRASGFLRRRRSLRVRVS